MSTNSPHTNPGEFDAMASAWLEGRATAEQVQRLGEMVEATPSARDRLLGLADLHACLVTDAKLWASKPEPVRDMPSHRRVPAGWACAVGVACVLCGLLGASVVWAMNGPKLVATVERVAALVDGGFESRTGRLPTGFPTQFGVWSGDESEIVPGDSATNGKQVLRFIRAEREPGRESDRAASCDVYQLVDLRSLRAAAAEGEASLEFAVQFRDAREAVDTEPVKFICRLYAFAGTPEPLGAEWPLTQKEALATGSGSFDSTGGEPHAWHNVTTKILLPAQAEFAVVHLVAHKPITLAGTTAQFGQQFADDVRLTFKSQPVLPERLGQR